MLSMYCTPSKSFNTQPPKGGCASLFYEFRKLSVSTHSRLKAADDNLNVSRLKMLFQHTAA